MRGLFWEEGGNDEEQRRNGDDIGEKVMAQAGKIWGGMVTVEDEGSQGRV